MQSMIHITPLYIWRVMRKLHNCLLMQGRMSMPRHCAQERLYCIQRRGGAAQGANKSYQKYLDLTKLLITKGADVNVKLKSGSMVKDNKPYRAKSGETTLHRVARSYSEKHASEVCELHIVKGALVNERNIRGHTPLDEALSNQRSKTADHLRKHGGKTSAELKAEGK